MRQTLQRTSRSALLLLAAWALFSPMRAAAQSGDPDLREIIPYLMLVIDTSASMERKPACSCSSAGCEECLPDCTLPNSAGVPPKDPQGRELKKNRWAVVLEALTGSFTDFQCERLARTSDNGMTYDIGFSMPHYQPWDCLTQLPFTGCAYGSANATVKPQTSSTPPVGQQPNGIIDTYANRLRFGLMTFDGFDTYVGAAPLVPKDDFEQNLNFSEGVQGLWSYGDRATFRYPGCDREYMMDTGVRSAKADEGNLISLDSCLGPGPVGSPTCPTWCGTCPGDQTSISDAIQTALLKSRPYGGTPIAAALDDLYHHLSHDLDSDQFGSCRHRFALLMTDGLPDLDYRDFDCDCAKKGGVDPCGPGVDPTTIHCPYPLPEDVAKDLIHGRAPDNKAMIEQLFVVGLAVGDDTRVLDRLNKIAEAGCPYVTGCDVDGDHNTALFADDLSKLVQNLSTVINSLIEPVSRSVPAFANGTGATSNTQYQINAGFEVATEAHKPWTGVMERRRFVCSNGVLGEESIGSVVGDKFQDVLNGSAGASRVLKTALPYATLGSPEGAMFKDTSTSPCGPSGTGTQGCDMVLFDPAQATNIQPNLLGLGTSDNTGRLAVMNWMHGKAGTDRANKRLGDIYHSSPAIVGAPQFDTTDEAFNLFRQRPEIANRPLVAYVGSNDGILHAFSIEDWSAPTGLFSNAHFDAGVEMWGFIPPLFLDNLYDNIDRHQFLLDGTPVVKNVYFNKALGVDATGQEYHTVLITGMREGGKAYVALDVTNPLDPKFLWQFTDPAMGLTFAQPGIGQATFKGSVGGTSVTKNGAIAILPGGVGQLGASGISGDCTNNVTNPSMRTGGSVFKSDAPQATGGTQLISHRSDVRCWKDVGRALYFVDVETGKLLKKIHRDSSGKLVFPSPLVSTPAVFGADIGTVTTRAFLTDGDGVVWRVDVSAPDQADTLAYSPDSSMDPNNGWVARPFHDIFWDHTPSQPGELTYEAPLLSVDDGGRVIVIVGTGDNNNFVKSTIKNRVVSLTEVVSAPGASPADYRASLNWELRVKPTGGLVPSELVTGSMGLFNGQLFFGTFIAVSGGDACDVGKGRIHAVDYIDRDINDTNGASPVETYGPRRIPVAQLSTDTAGTSVINVAATDAVDNFMVMGLGVTQRPTCAVVDTQDFNVAGTGNVMAGVSNVAQPAIYLVAQASGDKGLNSLVQKHANSKLGSLELKLNKTATFSHVTSWATSVD